jgi:hypothetical protein
LDQIIGESVYKGFSNQTQDFIDLIQEKYDKNADNKMESYINFFKKLAIAVICLTIKVCSLMEILQRIKS